MDACEPTFIYADLETEGFKGELLLQIAAVSDSSSFSVYINPHQRLPLDCTKLTGLSFYQNILYKDGKPLASENSAKTALESFNKWLALQGDKTHLVFHNAFGFDARVLTKHYLKFNISFPASIQFIHDSLPAFRKHIKTGGPFQIPNDGFKLTKLGALFELEHPDPHNAASDSLLLKQVCEAFAKQLNISIECLLDSYQKPPSFFVHKIQFPGKTRTKKDKKQK